MWPSASRRGCDGARSATRSEFVARLTILAGAVGVGADRHPGGAPRPDPTLIVLPGATSAEGIASGPGSTFFAGDLFTGDIFRGDMQHGTRRAVHRRARAAAWPRG